MSKSINDVLDMTPERTRLRAVVDYMRNTADRVKEDGILEVDCYKYFGNNNNKQAEAKAFKTELLEKLKKQKWFIQNLVTVNEALTEHIQELPE